MAAFPRLSACSSSRFLCLFSRRLSVEAAQRDIASTQTGIPVIVAHHTVKKAFIVHPNSRAYEPSLKHQWLTKTVLFDGLPQATEELDASFEDVQKAVEIFQDSLLQQLAFQKELKKSKTRFDEEIRLGIFPNILRICLGLSSECDRLKESFLDVSPKIHTHWVRKHEFYNLLYHPDLILWSGRSSDIFEKDIESTIDKSIPGPYDTYSQGLFQHPIVHLRNFPGYQSRPENPFHYCHTLFLSDTSNQPIEQVHAYGIMGMFGVLASKAMSNGIHVGQHLPTPLTTQCVISDGKEVVLMRYQLNTLSLQEDHGIKNCAWGTKKMEIFTRNPDEDETEVLKRSVKLYGSYDTSRTLPAVNEDCVKQILSFICQ